MASQREKAEEFCALHNRARKGILILPNAWDVPSARVFENAGFPAVATSSAGLMVSLGYPDGETIDRQEFFSAVKRISNVLTVPLSVDAVAGFGRSTIEVVDTVRRIVEAGAVGIKIEDFEHSTKKLHSVQEQVEKLRAIRQLSQTADVPIVVNARTDALRYTEGDAKEKLGEAIRRAKAYRGAGADCVYPMGLTDATQISTFVRTLDRFPTNVMVRKGLPPVAELERLGVTRISFGPYASYATMGLLKRISAEVLERGTYSNLVDGAITLDELNSLSVRKT